MESEKFIDVEKLIGSKSPKVLKWMPRFVLRYLRRIVHEEEINAFISANRDKKNIAWCDEVEKYMEIEIEVINLEKIPREGKIIIAMNHPLGGMDAIILVSALKGHREDLKFIVNDLLMNLEGMREMFVGVDKHGKKRVSSRQQIEELFESDHAVCIFPAGLVSRKRRGIIRDLTWRKTFITYAKKYNRTIVPIYIDGRLSNFFYRLSNFRTFLRIKANIEMLYLSDELFKQRKKKMRFVVGDPIGEEFLNRDLTDQKLAQEVKEKVYELSKDL
jgi:putative hemolysin